jgi:hypothetical protein
VTDQPVPPLLRLTLRVAIVVIAALELYWFSDGYALSWDTLVPPWDDVVWFNLLFALGNGVIVPLCALVAAGLGIAGKRLGLAGILLCVGPVLYALPVIAFGVGIMIYGF